MKATLSAVISNDLLCSPLLKRAARILFLLCDLQQRQSFQLSGAV